MTTDATHELPKPRLVLRLGALGNREFGMEKKAGGVNEEAGPMKDAAAARCREVLAEIASILREMKRDEDGRTFPGVDRQCRYCIEKHWGWFFGRGDVWRRDDLAGDRAPVFRDEAPLVSILAGLEDGGDSMAVDVARELDARSAGDGGATRFQHVPVICEDGDIPDPWRGRDPAGGLSVGTIPKKLDASALDRSAAVAHAANRAARALGFRAQSEALRHHADVLLAIWDPAAEGKAGGTGESVAAALRERLPVVAVRIAGAAEARIDVLCQPDDLRKAADESSGSWKRDLRNILRDILDFPEPAPPRRDRPPPPLSSYHPRVVFHAFRNTRHFHAPWPGRFWKPFDEFAKGKLRRREFLGEVVRAPFTPGVRKEPAVRVEGPAFQWHYGAAKDRASDMAPAFGDAYRGGILTAYTLGALAVLLALLGGEAHARHWHGLVQLALGAAEFGVLLTLCALWRASSIEDWHEAYTDARILAEALRCMSPLGPLGVHTPLPKLPPHLSADSPDLPRRRWSVWYFRALVREAPLRLAPEKPDAHAAVLGWVEGQTAFHKESTKANERIAHGIEHAAVLAFAGVLLAVLLHLALVGCECMMPQPESHSTPDARGGILHGLGIVLFFITVGVPALLAALNGFLAQIEAERLRRRSESMAEVLAARSRALKAIDCSALGAVACQWRLATEAAGTAALLVNETADWALIYKNADIHAG